MRYLRHTATPREIGMEERLYRRKVGGLSFMMGGDGAPLLFLHGIPGSAHSWLRVGSRLTTRFRVIIPDLMGFGESDTPAVSGDPAEQAQAVRQLLAHLHISEFYLAGHGFGGAMALTLMRGFPELTVRGLVLAATHVFADTRVPLPLHVAKAPGVNSLAFWSMAGNRLGLRLFYENAVQNKEDLPWSEFRRHLTPGGMRQTRRMLQRSLANMRTTYADVEAMLPNVNCPALVIWGDEDPYLAVAMGERLRATLPDARLKVYAFTGHFVPEERPIETAEDIVLRFDR